MVRKYGQSPFNTVVVHGGPGALGSVACVARELSEIMGVVEPLQSEYSIGELIEELNKQIKGECDMPVTLIGHSWGAFLSLLYTEHYPAKVKQIVLVGSAPLIDEYVPLITERRLRNLSKEDGELFLNLLAKIDKPDNGNALRQLAELVDKSDNYQLIEIGADKVDSFPVDNVMYARIWEEARAMRSSGELMERVKKVNKPIFIIQGENDPHPLEGVTEPLELAGVPFKYYVLPQCGHSPFKEKLAVKQFYSILRSVIEEKHSHGNL